jgi:protease-4
MKSFLKYTLASLFALVLFAFLGVVLLGGLAGAAFEAEEVTVKEKSVLVVPLGARFQERTEENPFEELNMPVPFAEVGSIGLLDALRAIRQAKDDDNIQAICLKGGLAMAGMATLEELQDAILDFKKSGKKVYAYGDMYSEGAYLVASAADSIFLNPVGLVEFNGLRAEVVFLKKMMEKIGVKPLVFRVGQFKSAVEPFLRDNMSEENRLQLTEYLNSIYEVYLRHIAQNRNKSVEELRAIADSMLVRTAEDARRFGLVTHVAYADEMEASLKKTIGAEDKINYIPLQKYMKAKRSADKASKNRIAVIVAEGEIVDCKGGDGVISGEEIAKEIKKAREDERVKAIVLRINSPGGSFFASDKMWREVTLTKGVKPIVASMSDLAASGGYYMAMNCDTIVARPTTLTGSIGIFGVLFEANQLLNDKLGITTEQVTTGPYADLGNPTRPMREDEKAIIQAQIERGYEIFTTKAAEGRGMPREELLKVASGRIWSGVQAKARGLVDVLGSYDDAVRIAAQMAGIGDDYRVRFYPRQKPWIEKLLGSGSDVKNAMLEAMKEYRLLLEPIEKVKRWQGMQARLPFELRFLW